MQRDEHRNAVRKNEKIPAFLFFDNFYARKTVVWQITCVINFVYLKNYQEIVVLTV